MIKQEYVKCPNCKFILDALEDEVKKSYGNIPMKDFLILSETAERERHSLNSSDYLWLTTVTEFNFDIFKTKTTAHCTKCNYEFEFNHEEKTKDLILIQKLEK